VILPIAREFEGQNKQRQYMSFLNNFIQCSGSRIWGCFNPWIPNGKRSGSWIRDSQ
jgi:hypothetical protein